MEQFAALGFKDFELRYEPRPGQPLALGVPRGYRSRDRRFDSDGERIYFEVEDGQGVHQRVYLPEEPLVDEPVDVGGAPVWTLTPLALIHIRRGLELLGT